MQQTPGLTGECDGGGQGEATGPGAHRPMQQTSGLTGECDGGGQGEATGPGAHVERAVHQDVLCAQLQVWHVAPDQGGVGLDGQRGQGGRLHVQQHMPTGLDHHLHDTD